MRIEAYVSVQQDNGGLRHRLVLSDICPPLLRDVEDLFQRRRGKDEVTAIDCETLGVEFEDKLGCDAKVGAAAADGEEEVWMGCGAGGDDGTGCCDDGCLEGLNVMKGWEGVERNIPARGCRWPTRAFSRSLRPKSS